MSDDLPDPRLDLEYAQLVTALREALRSAPPGSSGVDPAARRTEIRDAIARAWEDGAPPDADAGDPHPHPGHLPGEHGEEPGLDATLAHDPLGDPDPWTHPGPEDHADLGHHPPADHHEPHADV